MEWIVEADEVFSGVGVKGPGVVPLRRPNSGLALTGGRGVGVDGTAATGPPAAVDRDRKVTGAR